MVMPGPVQPEGREMAFNRWGEPARMPAERAVYDSSETEWRPQTPVKPLSFLIPGLYFHLLNLRRTAACSASIAGREANEGLNLMPG